MRIRSVLVDDGGSHKLRFETGQAYWLDADPAGRLHGDANDSDRSIELMVIELKGPLAP